MSRLLKSEADDPQDILKKLRQDLKRDYFKPTIKQMKKKGAKTKRTKMAEGPSFELVLAPPSSYSQQPSSEDTAASASQAASS